MVSSYPQSLSVNDNTWLQTPPFSNRFSSVWW